MRSGRTRIEFCAALFVGAATRRGTVQVERQRIQLLAILLTFALDGVAALRALAVLAFHLLHGFGLGVNLFGDLVELLLKRAGLSFQLRELAGQHDAQLVAHLIAQLGVALGLRRLALQRIHLPRDFVEDVVDARQVQFRVF